VVQGHVASDHGWLVILSRLRRSREDEPGVEAIRSCVHRRHPSTPGYLLALLRELLHVSLGLTEITETIQVRKTNKRGILYQFSKRVRKSILTFRTWNLVDFFSRGSGPFLRVDLNPRISKICTSWMSVWNISANYVFVSLKFNLNWNIWKPFLKSLPLDFSGQRLGNTSLVV